MTKEKLQFAMSRIKARDEEIAKLELVRAILGDLVDFYLQNEKDFPEGGGLQKVDKLEDVRYDVIDDYLALLRACRDDDIKRYFGTEDIA